MKIYSPFNLLMISSNKRDGFTQANAQRLAGRGNVTAALDGLLDILRQDGHYCKD
jgi:hypothetical protein